MTDTQIPETDETAQPTRRGRRWLVIAGVIAAVLVVSGGAWAIVASQDDAPVHATEQIGRMQQGCQQWARSVQGSNGPSDAWCMSLTDWMNSRMSPDASSGNGMMMGSMMWQDPASMQTTCEQWMSAEGDPSDTGATLWCGQMVDWMDRHMGGWDKWMHDGPMMGRS